MSGSVYFPGEFQPFRYCLLITARSLDFGFVCFGFRGLCELHWTFEVRKLKDLYYIKRPPIR